MSEIELNLKRFLKYLCFSYFALPDPKAGGWLMMDYAKKIQDSKVAQKIKAHGEINKTVA